MHPKLLTLLLALPLLLPQDLCVCQSLPWLFEHEEVAVVYTTSRVMTAIDTAKGCCHCHCDDVPEPDTYQSLNTNGLAPDAEHTALFVEAAPNAVSELVVLPVSTGQFTPPIADAQRQYRAAHASPHPVGSRTLAHFSLRI